MDPGSCIGLHSLHNKYLDSEEHMHCYGNKRHELLADRTAVSEGRIQQDADSEFGVRHCARVGSTHHFQNFKNMLNNLDTVVRSDQQIGQKVSVFYRYMHDTFPVFYPGDSIPRFTFPA